MAKASYLRNPSPQVRALWRQRELARRIAGGASPQAAAALAGAATGFVERLMGDLDFLALVEAFHAFADEHDETVLARLSKLCRGVLIRAIVEDQEAAVAAWFLWTVHQGDNPFSLLAEQVWQGLRRAVGCGEAPDSRPTRQRPDAGFLQQVALVMGRTGGRLRALVHREIAAQALIARIDQAGLPEPAVDAVLEVTRPPVKAVKPEPVAQGPVVPPPKVKPRPMPRRVHRTDRDDAALATLLDQLTPAEREIFLGAQQPNGP